MVDRRRLLCHDVTMSSAAQPYPAHLSGLDARDAKEQLRRAIRAERDKHSHRARTRAAAGFAQNQSLFVQADQGGANDRAADRELDGKLAFCRQPGS
jgi:hypothetical protein